MKAGTVPLLNHQSLKLSIKLGQREELIKYLLTKPIDFSDLVSFPKRTPKPFRKQGTEEGGNYHNNACPSQSVKVTAEPTGYILDASLPLLISTLFQRWPERKPLQRSQGQPLLDRASPGSQGECKGEERKEIGIY